MKIRDIATASEPLQIESLDQEGRGIARRDGKTIFVEGALPGERVAASVYRRKPSFEVATTQVVLKSSSSRVDPGCRYFGICGGCALQHLDESAQVAVKQRVLEDALWHIGKVRPEQMLSPIRGPAWHYRHRARFTVRHVPKKGGMLVGFHEKRSSYVADMKSCAVMPERISSLLPKLRELIGELSIHRRVPQVEVAVGEGADVLVFRILDPLRPMTRIACGILPSATRSTSIFNRAAPIPHTRSIRVRAPTCTTRSRNSTCAFTSGRPNSRRSTTP